MRPPVLSVQTVYCHASDRVEARRLGSDLYNHLTRPVDDPLGYGAGIPVQVGVTAEAVDLQAADVVVLVPVLGKSAFNIALDAVLKNLNTWHKKLGEGHVLPVPISSNWRAAENRLPGKQLLTELYSPDDPRRRTLDEVVLAITRLLFARIDPDNKGHTRERVQLFVSHAKADLKSTDAAAKRIHDYVVTDTTGNAFFDTTNLQPGESLTHQLDAAAEGRAGDYTPVANGKTKEQEGIPRGALIVVRGDAYSSRMWCQRELLRAKLRGIPTLTVEVLRNGEQRSSPYGGNGPSLVWNGNPATVVSRAIVECLRSMHFHLETPRIIADADLPEDVQVIAHQPELLDLAQGPLRPDAAQLVLHPDPELSVIERQVLKAAQPRLQYVTPTTAFRRLLNQEGGADVASPLEGMQIAMSLSDSPDADGPTGYTAQHVKDATIYIARALISAGAAIAYGGDFRAGGFTELLAQLIQTYNQTATEPAQSLHNYAAATISLDDAPDGLPLKIHHLLSSAAVAKSAVLPAPAAKKRAHGALYYSDMRRVMARHTAARVILGGQTEPRVTDQGPGYVGLYPGVVEEAWRTLEVEKPLYVLGGFGGAAGLVAALIADGPIPPELRFATWKKFELFTRTVKEINADSYSKKLGLPKRMDDLAAVIKKTAHKLLSADKTSQSWNGLTVAENRELFWSRDPVTLTSLVLKGLLAIARAGRSRQLKIELVQDSVTAASKLDAIAIATLDRVPLGGAGAALDQAIGGMASAERAKGRTLISLREANVDADWLFLASLGGLGDPTNVAKRVEQAAREIADQANRHGFRRLGVVTFGGSMLSNVEEIAKAMKRGFKSVPDHTTIVWFETNEDRFQRLRKFLERPVTQPPYIKLTTLKPAAPIVVVPKREEPLFIDVRLTNSDLEIKILPPAGSAVVPLRSERLSAAQLQKFAEGSGHERRDTPDLKTLQKRGNALARALLGDDAAKILAQCQSSRMVVIHDAAASRLPFEMLGTAKPDLQPAVLAGISRRLAVSGLTTSALFAKPPKKGQLNVLLVVNPTEDLPGTEAEAKAVQDILEQQRDRVNLTVLRRKRATCKAVKQALASVDVLHYCGHGFFNGPGPKQSGLVLADRERLTAAELQGIASLPRVAFVNACEVGRVRGAEEPTAVAFAELFLRSGVEAYLGTFWRVQDRAAAKFATDVYTRLALGDTLEAAVLHSRKSLLKDEASDWANYLLYGDGNFKLVVD